MHCKIVQRAINAEHNSGRTLSGLHEDWRLDPLAITSILWILKGIKGTGKVVQYLHTDLYLVQFPDKILVLQIDHLFLQSKTFFFSFLSYELFFFSFSTDTALS